MYEKTGSKIVGLANVVAGIGIALSIIVGLVCMIAAEMLLVGLLIAVVGSLLSWLSSLLLAGFGELIDNTDGILEALRKQNATISEHKPVTVNGTERAYTYVQSIPEDKRREGVCEGCCEQKTIAVCKRSGFTSDYKLCVECINKYKAIIK